MVAGKFASPPPQIKFKISFLREATSWLVYKKSRSNLVTDLTNSKAHFIADFADLSLHGKVKNRMNNEGSTSQRGVE